MNSRSEEFGSERLIEVVRQSRDRSAREIVQAVLDAVEDHRAGFAPNDDTTVVVLRLNS
jgi:serine phosphatase RsbU (regulator of sigma subunit)